MEIIHLTWDSNFFGLKTGKVIVSEAMVFDPDEFLSIAKKESYDLVYIFVDKNLLPKQKAFSANVELMDIHVSMKRPFLKSDFLNCNYNFRTELSSKELSECYTIAEQTAIVSRFFYEPLVGPQKTKDMYRLWIDNTINKSYSDGLFIIKDMNEVLGIHLIKTLGTTGHFTLTGVNINRKCSGLGSRLWNQSFAYWAQETSVSLIQSPFSFQNIESFNFHLKHGFSRIDSIKYIYHYRNTCS